jgi:hypothetical protein
MRRGQQLAIRPFRATRRRELARRPCAPGGCMRGRRAGGIECQREFLLTMGVRTGTPGGVARAGKVLDLRRRGRGRLLLVEKVLEVVPPSAYACRHRNCALRASFQRKGKPPRVPLARRGCRGGGGFLNLSWRKGERACFLSFVLLLCLLKGTAAPRTRYEGRGADSIPAHLLFMQQFPTGGRRGER